MLNVVTFRWHPFAGYRSVFPPYCVQTLANMVRRHYPLPHRFICYTDTPDELARLDGVEVRRLWRDLADVPTPTGAQRNPSCYRRLRLFAPQMRQEIGERLVALDLDCVITSAVTPLWDQDADFIAWGDTRKDNHYNGSMILHRTGTLTHLWEDFDPARSPHEAKEAGYFGSDQGWLSYKLGRQYPRWTRADGVYSYRNDLKEGTGQLPPDSRIVFFHGHMDPWDPEVQKLVWVRKHYR